MSSTAGSIKITGFMLNLAFLVVEMRLKEINWSTFLSIFSDSVESAIKSKQILELFVWAYFNVSYWFAWIGIYTEFAKNASYTEESGVRS